MCSLPLYPVHACSSTCVIQQHVPPRWLTSDGQEERWCSASGCGKWGRGKLLKTILNRLRLCLSGLLQNMKPFRFVKGQARYQLFCGVLRSRPTCPQLERKCGNHAIVQMASLLCLWPPPSPTSMNDAKCTSPVFYVWLAFTIISTTIQRHSYCDPFLYLQFPPSPLIWGIMTLMVSNWHFLAKSCSTRGNCSLSPQVPSLFSPHPPSPTLVTSWGVRRPRGCESLEVGSCLAQATATQLQGTWDTATIDKNRRQWEMGHKVGGASICLMDRGGLEKVSWWRGHMSSVT